MNRMRVVMFSLILVPLFVVSVSNPSEAALESWRVYDNFDVGPISPRKWLGWNDEYRYIREEDRTIVADPSGVGRDLRLMQKAWGAGSDNTGEELTQLGLSFARPGTVKAMKAKINVRAFNLQACAANTSSSIDANAGLVGDFFNVNQATRIPGNFTGDVFAVVAVGASTGNFNDAGTQLHAFGMVFKCNDSKCSWQNRTYFVPDGQSGDNFLLGSPVAIGSWVTISVAWDQAAKQFVFQRDAQTPVSVSYASLAMPNPGAPAVTEKNIATINNSSNCMPPNVPGTSKIDVLIDNVQVNQTALP